MQFTDLLDRHVAPSLEKQFALADYIGERGWQLSLSDGRITFDDDLSFPVQLLGTESEGDGSWLWAWANTASDLPAPLLRQAEQLRDLGEREGIAELREASFDLSLANGHLLALVAAGVCDADCYYRGPYAGGAVFMLLGAPALRQAADPSPARFVTVLTQAISLVPLNHRAALQHYAAWKGWLFSGSSVGATVHAPDGTLIKTEFDDLGRLSAISTVLSPDRAE